MRRVAMTGATEDEEARLTPADYRSLAAFRLALRRFAKFSTDAARDAGLTTHQHQALLAIKGHDAGDDGAMTIGGLAEQLLVAPHSAAELVARLDAQGLVERIVDEDDRRRVGLRLTPLAETALRKLSLTHQREVRVLAPRLMAILKEFEPP